MLNFDGDSGAFRSYFGAADIVATAMHLEASRCGNKFRGC